MWPVDDTRQITRQECTAFHFYFLNIIRFVVGIILGWEISHLIHWRSGINKMWILKNSMELHKTNKSNGKCHFCTDHVENIEHLFYCMIVKGQRNFYHLYLQWRILSNLEVKIVAAFRGMHVSPAKHSYASATDGRTDGQTDRRRTKWSLCVAMLRRRHKNHLKFFLSFFLSFL